LRIRANRGEETTLVLAKLDANGQPGRSNSKSAHVCYAAESASAGDGDGALDAMRAVKTAARTLGLEIVTLEIQRAEEIEPAIETLNGKASAVPVEAGVADESPIVAAHARDRRRGEPAGLASDPKSLARNNKTWMRMFR
jgi:hypothetical protein